jgi:hypothetical protein
MTELTCADPYSQCSARAGVGFAFGQSTLLTSYSQNRSWHFVSSEIHGRRCV